MNISLNNRDFEIKDRASLTIRELFEIKKFTFPHIIVKVNNKLIKKEQYETVSINEGDKVEAIHLIGGG